ncbi:MAG: lysis system i-spanin subunit Rz [Pseudomonas paracarnis]
MTPVQKLIGLGLAILLALAIGFGGAWEVQDWRLGKKMAERIAEQGARHQKELDAITGEAWRQQSAELDKRLATEQQLAIQDQHHTKELSDAQRNQARLRDQLATADVRLSVLIAEDSASSCNVPTAPGAVGVVHAARRAQLDPAHAQRIIAITDSGDQGLIALRACQAYVRKVSGGENERATH